MIALSCSENDLFYCHVRCGVNTSKDDYDENCLDTKVCSSNHHSISQKSYQYSVGIGRCKPLIFMFMI